MRTLLAFVIAPLTPCVLTGIGQAFTQHAHDGQTWAVSFLGYTYLALPMSWLLSYTVGTLVFLILRCVRMESVKFYCSCAIVPGFSVGAMIAGRGQRFIVGCIFALLATSAAIVFALIRGSERKLSPADNKIAS